MRILLVEDDLMIGQVVYEGLQQQAYAVDWVKDGEAATLALATHEYDVGLVFICYQANLQDGFIDVQKRLDGEPLEEYIKPFGGGFFFTLPGFKKGEFVGQSLLMAAEQLA